MIKITDKIKEYIAHIEPMLSKKRFTHTMNVADMCFKLANIYGEDGVRAYTAGVLHDCQKEVEPTLMRAEVIQSGFFVDPVEIETPALWHAIAGAYYARERLKISDSDILSAIRFHTVAHDKMSTLEKIVYLGDLVSAERSYKDVEKYRKFAMEDLDKAMYESLKFSINSTIGKCGKIPACTFNAYNFYLEAAKQKGMLND